MRIEGARFAEICDVPRPATGIQLQEFLGMVNDARAFIPRLAFIAVPLDALRLFECIDIDDPTVWTPECEKSHPSRRIRRGGPGTGEAGVG